MGSISQISFEQPSTDEIKQLALDFFQDLWIAPADVFMRMHEVVVWRNVNITEPTLDIGCGDGSISKHIFAHLPKLAVGMDLNPADAMSCNKYKKVVTGDATMMKFADESFKTVVSNSTFEHIPDDHLAMQEVQRVLKPGGYFYVTVPTQYLKTAFQHLTETPSQFAEFNQRMAHYHYRSTEEWAQLGAESGLELTGYTRYLSPAAIEQWYKAFSLMIRKIAGKRELWSMLQEGPLSKVVPTTPIIAYEIWWLLKYFQDSIQHPQGGWQLLQFKKP